MTTNCVLTGPQSATLPANWSSVDKGLGNVLGLATIPGMQHPAMMGCQMNSNLFPPFSQSPKPAANKSDGAKNGHRKKLNLELEC